LLHELFDLLVQRATLCAKSAALSVATLKRRTRHGVAADSFSRKPWLFFAAPLKKTGKDGNVLATGNLHEGTQRILSPLRLPFRHIGAMPCILSLLFCGQNKFH
jgi:hypothetical protein